MRFSIRALVLLGGISFWVAGSAQDYPSRLVRMITSGSLGGPVDIASRIVAQRLSETWGQPFIVENRSGASEIIAAEAAAKAKPDGYTLLIAGNIISHNRALFAKLPYDPARSFAPVTLMLQSPMALVTNSKSPFQSIQELIASAKSPGKPMAWASAGIGTNNHITGEQFAVETGIKLLHVPYKGSAGAANAAVSGEVAFGIVALSSALPFAKAGNLKILAVTTEKRTSLAPEMPTLSELGVQGIDGAVRGGLYVPAGTPQSVIGLLNSTVNRILQESTTRERFASLGLEALGTTPEEYEANNRKVAAQVEKAVAQANIKVE